MTALTFTKSDARRPYLYFAHSASHTFRLFQLDGAWYLQAKLTGEILGVEVRLDSMTEARAVAARFVEVVDRTTTTGQPGETVVGNALDAAIAFVRRDPAEPVDLDAEVAPAAPAAPVVVIACAAQKLDQAAPAAELYQSANFALNLRAARVLAERAGGRVLILSALHGLVELDAVLAPYDVKMGQPGCIDAAELAAQLAAIAPAAIQTLLPRAYAGRLAEAAAIAGLAAPADLFANAPGIGYQRAVAAGVIRDADAPAVAPAGDVEAGQLALFAA
ncbi:hypothetical protein I5J36_gp59 [Mycobacterium phage Mendokysei]|uniref:DUF6884 domain-containing protein n=1 Tax=Mycobacterium phage Mendokysei TaxID=2099637 RepID=A0A2P1CGZ7_9CAUD|nr:hypothetical protein I5J36_gp59 [Mycobacterium phage Mendokysei]AVJ50275.1 hypothetical protein SEA_MENDOKYSEI_59 [Mycobacterium phage Mendokysei]